MRQIYATDRNYFYLKSLEPVCEFIIHTFEGGDGVNKRNQKEYRVVLHAASVEQLLENLKAAQGNMRDMRDAVEHAKKACGYDPSEVVEDDDA